MAISQFEELVGMDEPVIQMELTLRLSDWTTDEQEAVLWAQIKGLLEKGMTEYSCEIRVYKNGDVVGLSR